MIVTANKPSTEGTEVSNRVSPTCTPTKDSNGEFSKCSRPRRLSLVNSRRNSLNSSKSRKNSLVQSIRAVAGANMVLSQTVDTNVVTLGLDRSVRGPDIFAQSSSLRLDTGNLKTAHYNVIMSILRDPVKCGYLLNFCNKEHTAENLCFIMMVSRFRDSMRQDFSSWSKSWEELDRELQGRDENELVAKAVWPSKRLQRSDIQKLIQSIWDNFISDDSVSQICMPAKVFANIERRKLLIDYYGPDIFTEALLDPIKTLNQDVLPRFLASTDYKTMTDRISALKEKTKVVDIKVPAPTDTPILLRNGSITAKNCVFTVDEFCRNKILYDGFLKYLVKNLGENHLLCYRMICIFEDLVSEGTVSKLEEASDHAWKIYRYFAAPEAPLEVSLHSKHKKELIISLASVHVEMFDELKKSACAGLTASLNGYKFTDAYKGLVMTLIEEQARRKSTLAAFKKLLFRANNC